MTRNNVGYTCTCMYLDGLVKQQIAARAAFVEHKRICMCNSKKFNYGVYKEPFDLDTTRSKHTQLRDFGYFVRPHVICLLVLAMPFANRYCCKVILS